MMSKRLGFVSVLKETLFLYFVKVKGKKNDKRKVRQENCSPQVSTAQKPKPGYHAHTRSDQYQRRS